LLLQQSQKTEEAPALKKRTIFSTSSSVGPALTEYRLQSSADATEGGPAYGDRVVISDDCTLGCVLDGYVRVGVSKFVADHLLDTFDECMVSLSNKAVTAEEIGGKVFGAVREKLFAAATEANIDCKSGTDMCAVYVHNRTSNPTPDAVGSRYYYISCNVGQTQAFVCRNGVAVPLTPKPTSKRPANYGDSNMFDPRNIQSIARPQLDEECTITVTEGSWDQDEFVIIASDGIWGTFSPQSAVDFVQKQVTLTGANMPNNSSMATRKNKAMDIKARIATDLIETGYRREADDNMGCVIIWLKNEPQP
jgi:serine/threonine protein phosphatase PrpC